MKHSVQPTSQSEILNKNVALFGEVLADVFPEQSVLGGAPFNVARHLHALGLRPLLISRTGSDALREALLQEMAGLGMEVAGIQCDTDHPTGQVRVILEEDGHRFDILPDQAYDYICSETTRAVIAKNSPRLAYFGTLAQRSGLSRLAAGQFLQACECPQFLDINLRAPWYDAEIITRSLQAADILKLNEEELAIIAVLFGLGSLSPEAQVRELQQRYDLQRILVTCGAAGCWLLDERQQVLCAAPVPIRQPVVDTVGAGDAFAAVYMLGLIYQWDISVTLQRACDYAAAICRVRGAAPASMDFFRSFKQAWASGS